MEAPLDQHQHPAQEEEVAAEHPLASGGWAPVEERQQQAEAAGTTAAQGMRLADHCAITHSVLMRAKQRTVRYIKTVHDLRAKTIRLRSDQQEHTL